MGSRSAFGFYSNGKDYLTYIHSDSEPNKLGDKIGEYLNKFFKENTYGKGIKDLKEKVSKLILVETEKFPSEEDAKKLDLLGVKYEEASGSSEKKPSMWFTILSPIKMEPFKLLDVGFMEDNKEFIYNSLFCEWGYIVNLDTEMLEVYRGDQREYHTKGRYCLALQTLPSVPPVKNQDDSIGFYPCALLGEIPLDYFSQTKRENNLLSCMIKEQQDSEFEFLLDLDNK